MTKEEEFILSNAVSTFGESHQHDKLIEEMSELTKAILKLRHFKLTEYNHAEYLTLIDELHYELADVRIVLDQMDFIYHPDKLERHRASKLARLKQRIEEHGKPNL